MQPIPRIVEPLHQLLVFDFRVNLIISVLLRTQIPHSPHLSFTYLDQNRHLPQCWNQLASSYSTRVQSSLHSRRFSKNSLIEELLKFDDLNLCFTSWHAWDASKNYSKDCGRPILKSHLSLLHLGCFDRTFSSRILKGDEGLSCSPPFNINVNCAFSHYAPYANFTSFPNPIHQSFFDQAQYLLGA